MTRWLFDLGNTRLKWACLEGREIVPMPALTHAEADFERRLERAMTEAPRAHSALIASVAAPDLTARVAALCHRHGIPTEYARTLPECQGVRIAYADPDALGIDRFLALLAARHRSDGPWLLVSVGTALTIDLLAADGTHLGGLIAPAPDLMRLALAEHADRLRVPPGQARTWGRSTGDAIAGGVEAAALGMIERCYALACDELDCQPTVLIAGGGAEALLPSLIVPYRPVADLVLTGLALYADRLTEAAADTLPP